MCVCSPRPIFVFGFCEMIYNGDVAHSAQVAVAHVRCLCSTRPPGRKVLLNAVIYATHLCAASFKWR